jgi:hypothetical protein
MCEARWLGGDSWFLPLGVIAKGDGIGVSFRFNLGDLDGMCEFPKFEGE